MLSSLEIINPVAALATLILLSYSKILRTVIVALSFTSLEYPDDTRKWVWLYDGTVPYFQRADHIVLGAFAIAILVLLFLPYTFLLLCGQWFQVISDHRIFSWLNKIKPFMDANYAPFKKETRYWIGVLLLVRCSLFLVFAFNVLGHVSVNLLAITTATACLLALAWLHGRLYEKLYNDILEASFTLNLCILAAATFHVKAIGGYQDVLAYISVSVALVTFVAILLYHTYRRLRKTELWKKIPKSTHVERAWQKCLHNCCKNEIENEENENVEQLNKDMPIQDSDTVHSPTTTTIVFREPLLEK